MKLAISQHSYRIAQRTKDHRHPKWTTYGQAADAEGQIEFGGVKVVLEHWPV